MRHRKNESSQISDESVASTDCLKSILMLEWNKYMACCRHPHNEQKCNAHVVLSSLIDMESLTPMHFSATILIR